MMVDEKLYSEDALTSKGKSFFSNLIKNVKSKPKTERFIELNDIHKKYKTKFGWKHVFSGLSVKLPHDQSLGILGQNGAGKSTLMRLLADLEHPDKGYISRNGLSLSWPIGNGNAGAHPKLTGRENIKFICRLYNESYKDRIKFIDEFADLGVYLDIPFQKYSRGMKKRFSLAINMAFDFDTYLIDEGFSGGDNKMQRTVRETFAKKREDTGCNMIVISHNRTVIEDFADIVGVLHEGKLKICRDVQDAFEFYESL